MSRERIHGLWIERIGSGFVLEGYMLGVWDSDGTPGPIPFKGIAENEDSLSEWLSKWIDSWASQKVVEALD